MRTIRTGAFSVTLMMIGLPTVFEKADFSATDLPLSFAMSRMAAVAVAAVVGRPRTAASARLCADRKNQRGSDEHDEDVGNGEEKIAVHDELLSMIVDERTIHAQCMREGLREKSLLTCGFFV